MKNRRQGQAFIEFVLVGIPVILLAISVVTVSIDMWQYDDLAYGVQATARYVAMHGRTCIQDSSSCTLAVSDITSYLTSRTLALDPAKAQLTLKGATSTTVCNPVSSCSANSSQFPSSSDNGPNFDITVRS